MVIDTHAHIIVPQITRDAAPDEDWRPRVFREDGQQVIEFGGRQIKSAVREFVDIGQILAEQGSAGVDHVLLAPWVSLIRPEASLDDGLRACSIHNEALSGLASQYPDHISGLGMIPLQDPERAAHELESVMKLPGLRGVEVPASVGGVYLGDDRFLPLWDAAEASGALAFIHPTTRGFEAAVFNAYYLWNTVGNPLETTAAAAHLVMAGVMETHPDLKVLLAHGGGAILSLHGRLAHAHTFQPQARARLKESPLDSLHRFYFDTVVHNADVLRDLIDFAGADHVVVGSDYPFDMGMEKPGEIVRALNLPPAEEQAILSGNAARLLGL